MRSEAPTLVVEAGDAFADTVSTEVAPELVAKRGTVIVEAFNRIGVAAYTPGERDLSAGLDQLKAWAGGAKFPFVAANLVDRDGKSIFAPSVVLPVGELEVGVVGLVGQRLGLAPDVLGANGFAVLDPVAAARQAVAKLSAEGVDLVVALTHLDPGEEEAVQAAAPAIALVVGSHAGRMLHVPRPLNPGLAERAAVAVDAGSRGKYLGRLDLYLPRTAKRPLLLANLNQAGELRGQVLALRREVARAEENIKKAKTEPASSEAQRARRLQGLQASLERNRRTLEDRRAELARVPAPDPSYAWFKNELVPVSVSLIAAPEISASVQAFLGQSATTSAAATARPTAAPAAAGRPSSPAPAR
ncbi:MAG: hypothetical protein HY903_02480 [Deltaproteobacteria bacterium]|nr:hypothetical protein [Deltaproteobacteria bacterium]